MNGKKEKISIILAGLCIGVISIALVLLGNPANMGFCIACFLRDISGALGLHQAAAVQYIRPEIPGLVLGSFLVSCVTRAFSPRGGRCPMILRLAGGDGNALFGLAGFAAGILCGVFFLNRGYSLKRTYRQPVLDGSAMPILQLALLALLIAAPVFIRFTETGGGPGGSHAPLIASLIAGLLVGALAQRTRLCMVGGIRDVALFREWKLLMGFSAILVSALAVSLLTGKFSPGFQGQPVTHTDGLWNALGMLLAGFGCVLLGGCPLRQLVLSGEGNADSAVAVLGLAAGAAFAHNFGLASSADGPTANGKIAVVIGIVAVAGIAIVNTFTKREEKA